MAIRVALNHVTRYKYDSFVTLSPHEVRLRPAPHTRTPILSYSLSVNPEEHFVNWQQDPYGNFSARYVFPKQTKELTFTVALVADMTVINPFDFFVEKYAEVFPFDYPVRMKAELAPYLSMETTGPLLTRWLETLKKDGPKPGMGTTDFLVEVNRRLMADISYLVRLEPGIQSCEETLTKRSGSCRDSAWLLVQIFRNLGLAARFVSGYLIQLASDVKSIDGPSGPEKDFTDLHAWTEVYVPGAGWVGLDPTSGLMAGEGHIPLACTAVPGSAAPITGLTSVANVEFEFEMTVSRIHEDPRVTKPFSDLQWEKIDQLGHLVDAELKQGDVRLTQGGEPTFVSIDDMNGAEWNYTALSPQKRELAGGLARRLKERFAPGGMYHFGQGKWYPGEPLPRWALGIFWRKDGKPIWKEDRLVAEDTKDYGFASEDAKRFIDKLAEGLRLSSMYVIPAYEDVWQMLRDESLLPVNVDPLKSDLGDAMERKRLAQVLEKGLGAVVGYVLPLKPRDRPSAAKEVKSVRVHDAAWASSRWPLRREHCYLVPGESPIGLRLPLATLPWVDPEEVEKQYPADPFDVRKTLDDTRSAVPKALLAEPDEKPMPKEVIHTALCVEARKGCVHVFMPPVAHLEDYLALVAQVEATAAQLKMPVSLEGYTPPRDPRVQSITLTPDPGVIEVNIFPCSSWDELVETTNVLYEEARQARLGTEKFMLDGRHTGTGGGNHITLGGETPAESPMLRRPDLLKSLITYWQNHPALSYLFSGTFVGPTSQAPRVDEARDDNLYELEIAFQQMAKVLPEAEETQRPWMVDRMLRNLLVDLTGNTHRAEFCIDKLYSPAGPAGRLGLAEFRAFEMQPHSQMSLMQALLLRALVARFWKEPYKGRVIPWGTRLHDQFMLPHFVMQDIRDVVRDLNASGYAFDEEWFAPFVEFRFPRYGTVVYQGIEMELRQAIEPWNVLGEEMSANATARYVDSSVERLQVKVRGLIGGRHVVACNGRMVPLHPTGVHGELVAGVRFRAWNPPSALHPTIGVHAPLTFDIVDRWSDRAIGGCMHHVSHPGGRNYDTFPVNANEAEARRVARFWNHGHSPGPMSVPAESPNPNYPMTLDLRREPI